MGGAHVLANAHKWRCGILLIVPQGHRKLLDAGIMGHSGERQGRRWWAAGGRMGRASMPAAVWIPLFILLGWGHWEEADGEGEASRMKTLFRVLISIMPAY